LGEALENVKPHKRGGRMAMREIKEAPTIPKLDEKKIRKFTIETDGTLWRVGKDNQLSDLEIRQIIFELATALGLVRMQ